QRAERLPCRAHSGVDVARVETLGIGSPAARKLFPKRSVGPHAGHRALDLLDAQRIDRQSSATRHLRKGTSVAHDDRASRRHSLQYRYTEALDKRGKHHEPGMTIEILDLAGRYIRQYLDRLADPELGR